MANTENLDLRFEQINQQILSSRPFNLLPSDECTKWLSAGKLISLVPGQTLISPNQLQDRLYLIISGSIRLLHEEEGQINTIAKRGSGQLVGWVSLLRASPCEWVSASEETLVLALSAATYVSFIKQYPDFQSWFSCLPNLQENYFVASCALESLSKKHAGWKANFIDLLGDCVVTSIQPGQPFIPPSNAGSEFESWHLSTDNVPGKCVGSKVHLNDRLPVSDGFNLPYRIVGFKSWETIGTMPLEMQYQANSLDTLTAASLHQLGIVEEDTREKEDLYPFVRGMGIVNESLAVCEMLALYLNVPFRRDTLKKVLESQFKRDKSLSLELLAGLSEILGLTTELGSVDRINLSSIEPPAFLLIEGCPVILFEIDPDFALIGDPRSGKRRVAVKELQAKFDDVLKFAIPRKVKSTPTSRFGWSWFTPLLYKYKKSLILVFIASLLAQAFGLAIPLLIQQIIDKVLAQGNTSSLNIIGTLMITLAIFQGCLLALRQYIFVDTTDRMDLTLGSAVIDRMLALPLSFFEKRPVGELSQRLGELNNIRSFLTGTALVSILNIIFAALYLVVMIMYSPLLTAVALSTFPVYAALIFGISPLYRYLIRQRANAQARTQSHLIEVLGGIQTVKAQHFELTARWKWQDRYKNFVTEGFKAVVLATTSGTVGSILNQISGLLVLWIGMYSVLQGDLTLGMLIAFRIIASKVTNPLMQLSGLYQGFQKMQVSMERLSDILDQTPELSNSDDLSQIALPDIEGRIRFEDVKFRFAPKGPYQIDRVSLDVKAGQFVGIVGQSGSGKSTLMKLLPRLYAPETGRIFIDDYDIEKVNLSSLRRQIGIVPQDSLLFEGTIAENIAMNDPQASDEAIIEASKIACAHDFIMGLGQGYATPISERGSNLSGGQRQRIAIARTVLSNPQLLVMDEATSALDYTTEKQLCLNLQEWASGRTVFFITHRLSSIKNSDLILVMHKGELVEQGTHSTLVDKSERYAALYKQQSD